MAKKKNTSKAPSVTNIISNPFARVPSSSSTNTGSPWFNVGANFNKYREYSKTINTPTTQSTTQSTTQKFNPVEGINWEKKYYDDMKKSQYASAAATLSSVFESYGLGGLTGTITSLIMQGKPADEVSILLRQTPTYKERFPAMDALAKRGRALSEGQYIGLEKGYDGALRAAGVEPKSLISGPRDYYNYIVNDVSVEEFSNRVNTATTLLNNANTEYIDAFKKYYGINKSDLLMYYLDPAKSAPELMKKAEIATVGGTATRYGLDIGERFAREITDTGLSKEAAGAFAKTAQEKEGFARLAGIEGQDLTTGELIESNLQMNTESIQKTKGLASRERARFSGRSAGTEILGGNVSGSY